MRVVSPRAGLGHIRIIEDQGPNVIEDGNDALELGLEGHELDSPARLGVGFHIRPVPIDEPIGEIGNVSAPNSAPVD